MNMPTPVPASDYLDGHVIGCQVHVFECRPRETYTYLVSRASLSSVWLSNQLTCTHVCMYHITPCKPYLAEIFGTWL